jgi:hypothetical protein
MEATRNFIGAAQESLAKLPLKEITLPGELKRVESVDGSVDLSVFKADKIEKIVFSIIKINSASVSEESVIVWPADTHDLPILWLNLTQMPGMNILIFDLIPLMDIVVWPRYGENYMTLLSEARSKVVDSLKDTITDKAFELRSLVAYALSPYKLLLMLADEGVAMVPQAVSDYVTAYRECWKKSEPLTSGEAHDFYLRKKKATRKLMRENDPGYPFMINIFGESNTKKVFNTVF